MIAIVVAFIVALICLTGTIVFLVHYLKQSFDQSLSFSKEALMLSKSQTPREFVEASSLKERERLYQQQLKELLETQRSPVKPPANETIEVVDSYGNIKTVSMDDIESIDLDKLGPVE